jgi:putative ABC transport system permease protein
MFSYVRRELLRNPRRTLSSLTGVMLGVGLCSGILYFIDGAAASMTQRAIAPLALDMQRVLTSPLGGGLELQERISGPSPLGVGQRARITLTVTNKGLDPAHEVVVRDEPPIPLSYVPGTTELNGKPLHDKGGGIPLAQGLAGSGLNIGTVPPKTTLELTYIVRAHRTVRAVQALPLNGTISSREDFVPAPANPPSRLSLEQLTARIARIRGVAAADALSLVDLPSRSLRSSESLVRDRVRVFAFDEDYVTHYPSIRIVAGSFEPQSVLLSAEAARRLAAGPGDSVTLRLPGRSRPVSLNVSGVVDLGRAKPLFYSRRSDKLEDFLYVPNSIIVTPSTFRHTFIPAFKTARAKFGNVSRVFPFQEVDVLVDRSRLHSDPDAALAQTEAIARSIERIAPSQDFLVDNISNALQVASEDAEVGKRMFLFLGLPGALLAAFLASYAGGVLAITQRREHAILRVRGAHRGHLVRKLVYETLLFATTGSALGVCLGVLSALWLLTPRLLLDAPTSDLLESALIAAGIGVITTALALYIPGQRSLGRDVSEEQTEFSTTRVPPWQRLRLDIALLVTAAIAEAVAYGTGAFDPPVASVSVGEAVEFPFRLLLAPLIAWFGGTLIFIRIFAAFASRLRAPPAARPGPVVRGLLKRSLRRRPWAFATGTLGVGLIVAFGISLTLFSATYDAAKAADARFVVGSDLRITPSVLSPRDFPSSFASKLDVQGISAVTPVVSKLENAVLIGPDNQDRADLTAIEPESFRRVASLPDSFFVKRSAAGAMAALASDPQGLLVAADTADSLGINPNDRVQVLLARGTSRQTLKPFRVIDLFLHMPGFPGGTSLVSNLGYYEAATGSTKIDFFLARSRDSSPAGLRRATAALRSGPARRNPVDIDTTETALDKDQSSLTALNVHGLVSLNSFYTLIMSIASIAIFVLGLMLQRRKEYVTLRAQGLELWKLQALVLGEATLVAACGLMTGILVGTGVAVLLAHVLRPLFILDPRVVSLPPEVVWLPASVMLATLASASIATVLLRRLRPTEILREH